jgi:tetratricopeptide (TPR) repeat protein
MEFKNEKNNTNSSLEFFTNKSMEVYKEWLDSNIRLNKNSTITNFLHLNNFIKLHSTSLESQKYVYLEKQFEYAIELNMPEVAKEIMKIFLNEFGRFEPKMIRMDAQIAEIEGKIDHAFTTYKKLISHNQEDRVSVKKFIGLVKPLIDIKKYIELWNEYLKVYQDDFDAWYELSDVYIQNSNYNKAIYCLEEVLLHIPNNYEIYTKIGDINSTGNNSESAQNAIKYYSQSILIKPSPRAFWGLVYAINIIYKANKALDDKTKNLLKIAKVNLTNFYKDSPFKLTIDQFYNFNLE